MCIRDRPHTSAGRIPSPKGYRIYVNELMDDYRLSVQETKMCIRDSGGDDVLSQVVAGLLIRLVRHQILPELFPIEDVNAHRGEVALGPLGLLLEFIDHVVLVHIHDAEPGGLLHGDFHDGDGTGLSLIHI